MKRVSLIILISFTSLGLFAQGSGGIGTGLIFQYGINNKADYLVWDIESQEIPKYAQSRIFAGPVFQFKNYQKVQAEVGLIYGRTSYESPEALAPGSQLVRINEIQMPLQVVLNTRSPIRSHSALVYHGGVSINYMNIPSQGLIRTDYNFISPTLTAGVRLATEIRSFGRFEYGLAYVQSLRDHHSFMFMQDEAEIPSFASIRHQTGQVRFSLIYYFTPRVYNWSKNRYKLTSLD